MKCEFAEKVSMLIDGELEKAESDEIKMHIAVCSECLNLEKDFLFFRKQLKELAKSAFESEIYKVSVFQSEEPKPFWKRGISLPVPIFAGLILAFIGVFALASVFYFDETRIDSTVRNPAKIAIPKSENVPGEISLARFDKGERAEIYVISKNQKENGK